MDPQKSIKDELSAALTGRDSHMSFEDAVADFPAWAINVRPPNVTYTPWHLLEHLRLTQLDILAYVTDPGHVSPDWPVGYWPDPTAEATEEQFRATIAGFLADRRALEAVIRDPSSDVLAPMAHAPRHSIAREARVIANHNSYHVGEFAVLRQVMGSWGAAH